MKWFCWHRWVRDGGRVLRMVPERCEKCGKSRLRHPIPQYRL
jgi:predicted Zn-ribbon and HTH transcriptional regulator